MKLSLKNRFLIPTLTLIVLGLGIVSTISYMKSEKYSVIKSARNKFQGWKPKQAEAS